MENSSNPKVESITIVPARDLSPVDRANLKLKEGDFAEIMVVKNSPKRMKKRAIKGGEKPTDGFRKAIAEAKLNNLTF